jgi:hypothetical protein
MRGIYCASGDVAVRLNLTLKAIGVQNTLAYLGAIHARCQVASWTKFITMALATPAQCIPCVSTLYMARCAATSVSVCMMISARGLRGEVGASRWVAGWAGSVCLPRSYIHIEEMCVK